MTKLKEKAAEYSFNIPSKIYQSCKTQKEMKLWKDEIEHAYTCGHNQCFQDFMEKAEEFFNEELYVSLSDQICSVDEFSTMKAFVKQFKNYMQNESEN